MKSKLELNLTKLGKAGAQLLVVSFLVLSACTKSVPTQQADPIPDPVTAKSNLEGERLFSSSMQNASMTSSDALPFSSGDNKRVRLEVTKDSLRVVETERDARYQGNKANDKLVLEIPVENFEIRCEKDKYGECTNKQANATDIPWDQMKNVKIKFAETKMAQLDFLPILVSQTYGEDCYEEVTSRLINSQIDADSMNWDVERTFKTKIQCVNELEVTADATVTAVYHYSMVKVDKVISKDYQTVSYPEGSSDEKTFGFFSTKKTKLAADNNKTETTAVQIMNRWNPNRTKIDYYLSDEFAKPENKMIKDLTYKTVNNLNEGLQQAGVNFTIDLHDPAGKNPGDIRNSMIVLVEDPINSGVIGYGPQTEDPVTGEIISARTVMFLGTIKQGVWATYEQIRREIKADADQASAAQKAAATPKYSLSAQMQNMVASQKAGGNTVGLTQFATQMNQLIAAGKPVIQTKSAKVAAAAKKAAAPVAPTVAVNLAQVKNTLKNYTSRTNPEFVGTDYLSRLRYLHQAKNCALVPAASAGYTGGISPHLKAQFSLDSKPWKELTDAEKQKVMDIILPETWITTLIHEMGHNLGLRHNFQASEDKANFLSIDELQAKGIDHAVPFSSVMDYGDDLKALPYLGKYDIAALKFGYLRQVEVKQADGSFAETTLPTSTLEQYQAAQKEAVLKDYGYCTDEHVGINAGCKRFDLGTSYTEITQNYIKDYENIYALRNFRNGRANMSLMDDLSYAGRIGGIFRELRVMMEVRERIKYKYHLADDADEWESVSFLKDLNQASLISGVFLAKVLLVPDQTCALALPAKPNEIVALVPLSAINKDAMSCFDMQLNSYIVVAETGKSINSKKDPESRNAYADQIDMRGIWADKLMASKYLFNRQIGVFTMDDTVDNFLNIPTLRAPIASTVEGLMMNSALDTLEFRFADGSKQSFEVNYDLFDSQKINEPIHPAIARRMGLAAGRSTQLQEVVGAKFATQMNDQTGEHDEDQGLSLAFLVKRYDPSSGVLDKSVKSMTVNGVRYVADQSNVIALNAMDGITVATVLSKLEPKKVAEIANARLKKEPMPATATADEKAAWNLPNESLLGYLDGSIKSVQFYTRLLNILPNSNTN
ncbi:MAG: zinc-dependent metalloprotease [Bdellovibrio sp.]|nr:zinc-dependent metalloprotease [Bdellovibrio sp.]